MDNDVNLQITSSEEGINEIQHDMQLCNAVIRPAVINKDIEKIKVLAKHKNIHLKEYADLFMADVVDTKDISFILQFADIAEVDLKTYWDSTAKDAINANYPELLQYLQDELHIDFASEIQKLSKEERNSLNSAVWDAAERGNNEIVEYVIRQFNDEKTFNAAFVGAAAGGNRLVINLLYTGEFSVSNRLLNYALQKACSNGHTELVPCMIFGEFSLEKDDDGLDAVDYALMQTLTIVSSLLTANKQIEPDNHNNALKNAERLVELLKEYHK